MLTIETLNKQYPTPQGPLTVLRDINLTLGAGSSLALMGESGSGKSTLLHLVAALDTPDTGKIHFQTQELSRLSESDRADYRRRHLGLVFQQFNLIPSLRVRDNLAFQARIAGRFDPQWQQTLIKHLGLSALLDRYPEQLSGGQQQRVAIGRALAGKPDLVLADEPTGSLDEKSGDQVMALFLDLIQETQCSLLMVTHSTRLASQLQQQVHLVAGSLT
ncbi:ABC transporter ATP-binding protein [Nitrincola alkalilacustris]|uniref:ABC transporter ATP-binding protein n=1 Tax=Nitrincola alkalilacustris TaxID=1571224 RepID=UPI00124EAFF5|nr:ABC transporter ATP-binding protein [Nitrincola alkalilacustris]